jgi:hypothetical protein
MHANARVLIAGVLAALGLYLVIKGIVVLG